MEKDCCREKTNQATRIEDFMGGWHVVDFCLVCSHESARKVYSNEYDNFHACRESLLEQSEQGVRKLVKERGDQWVPYLD
ncbi:MAG: hypothetical protein AAF518_06190 [Spirochaetota bacterium]